MEKTKPTCDIKIDPDFIECRLCGHRGLGLVRHLMNEHGMDPLQYREIHKGAPLVSPGVLRVEQVLRPRTSRRAGRALDGLSVGFAGLQVPVWADVSPNACLPLPANYRLPRYGKLGAEIMRASEYLVSRRHLWISGTPGTGKDAFVHAFSARCRRPALMIHIAPGMDLESYLYTRSFAPGPDGALRTFWEYGKLWKAMTQGYVGKSGHVHPFIILLSDFDRATKVQVETLRLVLDSIEGRVMGPDGQAFPVVPGTMIIATANSQGGGDQSGRCISARPVDASIMNRFQRKIIFHGMSWKDELEVLRSKFPSLCSEHPGILESIRASTKALRSCIESGELYMEFSHRDLCHWLQACQDRIRLRPRKKNKNLLKEAAFSWVDGLPDESTRIQALRVIDPHIKGGVISARELEEKERLVEGF